MLYWVVLVSAAHQCDSAISVCVYIYIYPLPPKAPPNPSPHLTPLGHHRAPSLAPCVTQKLPSSNLFYAW